MMMMTTMSPVQMILTRKNCCLSFLIDFNLIKFMKIQSYDFKFIIVIMRLELAALSQLILRVFTIHSFIDIESN